MRPALLLAAIVASGCVTAPAVVRPTIEAHGDVSEAWIHGMHVLVRPVPDSEFVVAGLYVRGGAREAPPGREGQQLFSVGLARYFGTPEYGRNELPQRLASLSSSLRVNVAQDYCQWTSRSLANHWKDAFHLLRDNFLQPDVPGPLLGSVVDLLEGYLQVRGHFLQEVREEEDSAEGQAERLRKSWVYRGTAYATPPIGTAESIEGLRVRTISAQLASLREARRLVLVVVGKVNPEEVFAEAAQAFSGLPDGPYRAPAPPPLRFERPAMKTQARALPSVYVKSSFPAPGRADPAYATAVITLRLLNERLYEELRSRRNLTYAPGAWLDAETKLPVGTISFSSTDPNAAFEVVRAELARLRQTPPDDAELTGIKELARTEHYLAQASLAGQLRALAMAEVLGDDYRLAARFPEDVRAVTPAAVQAFAASHLNNLQTVILGDLGKIDRAIFERE